MLYKQNYRQGIYNTPEAPTISPVYFICVLSISAAIKMYHYESQSSLIQCHAILFPFATDITLEYPSNIYIKKQNLLM